MSGHSKWRPQLRSLFRVRSRVVVATTRLLVAAILGLSTAIEVNATGVASPADLVATAYVIAAFISGAHILYRRGDASCTALAIHVLEVLTGTALLYLTGGSTSPYFTLYLFSLVGATMIWRRRGALLTGAALLAGFLFTAVAPFHPGSLPPFDLNRFMVRAANLTAMGLILVMFGRESERIANAIHRLASWPLSSEPESPAAQALLYAREALALDHLIVVWEPPEEPWLYCTELRGRSIEERRLPPGLYGIFDESPGGRPEGEPPDPDRIEGFAEPKLLAELGVTHVTVVPLSSATNRANLLIVDATPPSPELTITIALVRSHIQARWDAASAIAAQREADQLDRQLRLARDLHDGTLQFLTGTNLQLQALLETMAPGPVADRLGMIRDEIIVEQKELRSLIRKLQAREASTAEIAEPERLADRISRMRHRWGIDLSFEGHDVVHELSPTLRAEITNLLSEAVANAVKHGKATRILARLQDRSDGLLFEIVDDGTGLSRHGEFDADTLARERFGPRSLRERTRQLGGAFTITSSFGGMIVRMILPRSEH